MLDDATPPDPQPTLNASFFDVLQSVREEPADLGSADAGIICRCKDGSEYVVKDGTSKDSAPIVPHCEWFCSELGEAINIIIPRHKIIRLIDGTYVFGSHIISGLIDPDENGAGYWFHLVKDGTIDLSKIAPVLSHIYAFDHFIHNVDRHGRNFLVQKQRTEYAVYAIDYSRAWLRWDFPSPNLPMPGNTVDCQRWFRNFWAKSYIDSSEVDDALARIRNLPQDRIRRIIEDHPPDWLSETQKNAILAWWGSADFIKRLDAISEGVKDGTCL